MRVSGRWLMRQIAGCLVLLLLVPFVTAATSQEQETSPSQQVSSAQVQSQNSDTGAKQVNPEPSQLETLPNSPSSVRSQTVDHDRQSSGQQQPSPTQQQKSPQEPVGTAAAQPANTTGVAASKPAGAAIAPAKQRRARSILIKVGALVGAGVAVGTVVALSSGSPSRPSGSR
ncbi:MAG TPA: hypothetical protein VN948_13625 [Terriglobales bacterium]|nr:hypothetical protein [Terriglobales bacterium]